MKTEANISLACFFFCIGAQEGTINSQSLSSTSHGPPSPRYKMMCSGDARKRHDVFPSNFQKIDIIRFSLFINLVI